MSDRIHEHEVRIRLIETNEAEARGAAREGAKNAARWVGAVGIVGMVGQLLISGLHL